MSRSECMPDEEDVEKDGANSYGEKIHYREDLNRTAGHVTFIKKLDVAMCI